MNSNNSLMLWVPVLLSVAGAIIGWFASGLFGAVLAIVGIIIAHQQKSSGNNNTVPLVLTWVFAIVAIIFLIIVISL